MMNESMNPPVYYTLLTDSGKKRIAEALAGSEPLDFKIMVLGDGNGALPKPTASQTQLVQEVWRGTVNRVSEHGTLPGHICVDCEIPADIGDFTIREVGLYDSKHNFVAIGNFPETFKPLLSEGSIRRMVIRIVLVIENMSAVAQGGQLPEYMTKEEVIEQISEAINTQKFPPAAHNHSLLDINELSGTLSAKAETVHEHTVTQISGLSESLNAKAPVPAVTTPDGNTLAWNGTQFVSVPAGGKSPYQKVKELQVEEDGSPQYPHSSVYIDPNEEEQSVKLSGSSPASIYYASEWSEKITLDITVTFSLKVYNPNNASIAWLAGISDKVLWEEGSAPDFSQNPLLTVTFKVYRSRSDNNLRAVGNASITKEVY